MSERKTTRILVTDLAAPHGVTVWSSLLLFYVRLSVPSHCSRETSPITVAAVTPNTFMVLPSYWSVPLSLQKRTVLSTAMRRKSLFPPNTFHIVPKSFQTHDSWTWALRCTCFSPKHLTFPQLRLCHLSEISTLGLSASANPRPTAAEGEIWFIAS